MLAKKFGLSQISWGIWGGVAIPGKFCNFSPLLNLETLFPALKLTRYCYLKSTFFFHENWQFNHKLGPSLFYKHTVPANKIWNQWDFKIPMSKLFSDLEKIWKCNLGLGLYSKNLVFYVFHELGKIQLKQHSKTPKSLC